MRRLLPLAGLLLVVGACLLVFFRTVDSPSFPEAPSKIVTIPPGWGLSEISQLLSHEQIIRHPLLFELLVVLEGNQARLKAGEYRLSGAASPRSVMRKLVRGEVVLHRVTIPEGWTVRQITELLTREGLVDGERFHQLAGDPAWARELGVEATSLEGYLFPETYYFPRGQSAQQVVKKMVDTFHHNFTDQDLARAGELGMTRHEVVTLASLIEKETGVPQERPLISAVFHNRLRLGMKLQSDPTVIYALPYFDGNLTKEHLAIDSPYNTYRHAGLPPGPIANPARASLQAALYPADCSYIYFVSKNDGSHHFSSTLAEQNRAVRLYQGRGSRAPQP